MNPTNLNTIQTQIDQLLSDNQEIESLFLMEKKRRGVHPSTLVFLGVRNVSYQWWCAMEALLNSQKVELTFFGEYLSDILWYAYGLGVIKQVPTNRLELLQIGDEIHLSDIERLLQATAAHRLKKKEEHYQRLRKEYQGANFGNINPIQRGQILETLKGELYPSIRGHFKWEQWVISGIPDGITRQYVYEFKTISKPHMVKYTLKPAFTQADFYGYYFKRPRKRVQFYIVEEDKVETWEEKVSPGNVQETLQGFKKLTEGYRPPRPKEWKCRFCKFKTRCPIT